MYKLVVIINTFATSNYLSSFLNNLLKINRSQNIKNICVSQSVDLVFLTFFDWEVLKYQIKRVKTIEFQNNATLCESLINKIFNKLIHYFKCERITDVHFRINWNVISHDIWVKTKCVKTYQKTSVNSNSTIFIKKKLSTQQFCGILNFFFKILLR